MADIDEKQTLLSTNNAPRAASMGTFQTLRPSGTFTFKNEAAVKRHHSIAGGSRSASLSILEVYRQQMYQSVPYQAVFGLQKRKKLLQEAFAEYITENEPNEKRKRLSSKLLLEDFQSNEQSTQQMTFSLIIAILLAAAAQFLFGYNTGVMNAPVSVVFPDTKSNLSWSLAVSAFAVGGPMGALAGGSLADSVGRRGALLMAAWTFLFGGLLQTLAPNIWYMVIARLFIGVASGFGTVVVPIYLGEMAPPHLRGTLGTVTQFALCAGILVSNVLAFPFATLEKWRYLFAVTPMIGLMQILCSPWMLESPRWLLERNGKSKKARYVLRKIRGDTADIEEEAKYLQMNDNNGNGERKTSGQILQEMLSKPNLRLMLFSVAFLHLSQQLSGINAVFYYSTIFFEGVISNPLLGTCLVGVINLLATGVAIVLMDRCNRRTLLLVSALGMLACCVIIVASLNGVFGHLMAVVAVNAYVSFFEFGLGPIPWLIVAEMFEGQYVSIAMSVSCLANWTANFIVGLAFPFINDALHAYSFAPFACILLMTTIYVLFILPETLGSTPDEIAKKLRSQLNESFVFESGVDDAMDEEWALALKQLEDEEKKS